LTIFITFIEVSGCKIDKMAETQPSGEAAGRVKGVCVVKPIIYGNISQHFGKKRESDGHTHDWTVYLKPYENEDMSSYVKKVQFRLHESYPNPNRIVSKPPYEVSETGWGEFEVQIKIHFNDLAEKPLTFYHVLKLFHNASSGNPTAAPGSAVTGSSSTSPIDSSTTTTAVIQGRKSVIAEVYDEVIFQDPTQYMYTLLTTTRKLTLSAYKHETNVEERRDKSLSKIKSGRVKVQTEISDFKDKLELAKETITKFKAEIARVQREGGLGMDSNSQNSHQSPNLVGGVFTS